MSHSPILTAKEVAEFLAQVFPQAFPRDASPYSILDLAPMTARVSYVADGSDLRPGDTVSGPTLMTLADVAMYIVLLAHIGRVELAVTTNLAINFLRKPEAGHLVAEARLLKLGRRLAVGDVLIGGEGGDDAPYAHATCTYSIPPR